MCNALLPALEASNRIPSERGGDASFKVLLAEDSELFSPVYVYLPLLITLRHADIVNQKVALKFLESAGHQTEVVENGALALEAVKKNFYDVSCLPAPSEISNEELTCPNSFVRSFSWI